jgi:hypothetical protein
VAYLLKARTVEPEKQPLLGNGFEKTSVSRKRLFNLVPAAIYKHATVGYRELYTFLIHMRFRDVVFLFE